MVLVFLGSLGPPFGNVAAVVSVPSVTQRQPVVVGAELGAVVDIKVVWSGLGL